MAGRRGVRAQIDQRVPLPDGAAVAADVYLAGDGGPRPALVVYLPYRKDDSAGAYYAQALEFFAAHGYASVLADFRGLGTSTGGTRPPFDPVEAEDGAAIVAWAAAQDWCDGSVGMWGVSYPAIAAMKTAALAPPALKAIVPVMGMLDPYEDFVYPGGSGTLGALGMWGVGMLAQLLLPPAPDAEGRWYGQWQERLERAEPYLLSLHEHADKDDFWQARVIDPKAIAVPAFCVGGWGDLFYDAMVRTFEGLAGPRKLLFGPWMHVLPDASPTGATDTLGQMLRWWDHWLRGIDTGIMDEPAVTLFVPGRGAWTHADDWPGGIAAQQALHLDPGGALAQHEPPAAGAVTYRADPTVGLGAGLWGAPTGGYGLPLDQRDDESRSLVFTTAPLEQPLLVAGSAEAFLQLRVVDGGDATVVVKLSDVAPDGASALITTGAVTVRHRASDPAPEPRQRIDVRLWNACYEVGAGHRLRMAIACADFPRLWPTPTNPTIEIATGGPDASLLRLPVATLQAVPGQDPRPVDPGTGVGPLYVEAQPVWTTTHDHVRNAVTVTTGGRTVLTTPDGEGRLEQVSSVRITVAPDHPAGAHIAGEARIVLQRPEHTVTVDAETWVSRSGVSMRGRVTLDEQPFFERRWTR